MEHFFAKYSLESPLRQYLLKRAEALEEEKSAVRRELDPTRRLKETLDAQVSKRGEIGLHRRHDDHNHFFVSMRRPILLWLCVLCWVFFA